MASSTKCMRCDGEMIKGTVYTGAGVPWWSEGEFSRWKWTFPKDMFKPEKHMLSAYKCTDCGHIEFFHKLDNQ